MGVELPADDWICQTHGRRKDHPKERFCPPEAFRPPTGCICPFPRDLCPWPPKCEVGGDACPACRDKVLELERQADASSENR